MFTESPTHIPLNINSLHLFCVTATTPKDSQFYSLFARYHPVLFLPVHIKLIVLCSHYFILIITFQFDLESCLCLWLPWLSCFFCFFFQTLSVWIYFLDHVLDFSTCLWNKLPLLLNSHCFILSESLTSRTYLIFLLQEYLTVFFLNIPSYSFALLRAEGLEKRRAVLLGFDTTSD